MKVDGSKLQSQLLGRDVLQARVGGTFSATIFA